MASTAIPHTMKPSDRFDSLIMYWSHRVELPWELVKRQMMAESSANPRAISSCGAKGLLQIMDPTARELNLTEPFNPDENLRAGTEYLARQLANVKLLLHGSAPVSDDDLYRFALASYNAGGAYVRRAIKQLMDAGKPINWPNVSDELARAVVRGRTADLKQVRGYIEKILPTPDVPPHQRQ